jgi:hypothetical protein
MQFVGDNVHGDTVAKHYFGLMRELALKIPFGRVGPDRCCIAGMAGDECQPARDWKWNDDGAHGVTRKGEPAPEKAFIDQAALLRW